jgi:hypothetical protein
MSTRKWTLGGFGLVVAVLAALAVTACDPYVSANTAQPLVLGVTMVDTEYNGLVPPDAPGCTAPYPQVNPTWAESAYPGLCNPANIDFGIPTVCPVQCFPPRTGPGYAPLFLGNLGSSYETLPSGSYTYATTAAYTLSSPLSYTAADESFYNYQQIRITFNKMLDPATVQPDPLNCVPPSTLRVFEGTVDVTAEMDVCYVPNSDADYMGASITVTPSALGAFAGEFVAGNTYRVAGEVRDQQGNPATVAVSVSVTAPIVVAPPAVR